jgi:putative transposase
MGGRIIKKKHRHNRHSLRLKGYDYSLPGAYFVTICTQNRECLFGDIVSGEMILNDAGKMIKNIWNNLPSFYLNIETDTMCIMPNHFHAIIKINPMSNHSHAPTKKNHATNGAEIDSAPTMNDAVKTFKQNRAHNSKGAEMKIKKMCPMSNHSHTPTKKNHVGADSISAPDFDSAPGTTHTTKGAEMESAPTLGDVVQTFKRYTTIEYIKMVKQNILPPFDKRVWQRNYYEYIIRDEDDYNRIHEYIENNPLKWELDSLNPKNRDID